MTRGGPARPALLPSRYDHLAELFPDAQRAVMGAIHEAQEAARIDE